MGGFPITWIYWSGCSLAEQGDNDSRVETHRPLFVHTTPRYGLQSGGFPNNLDLLIRLLTGWARWQWLTSWDSLADIHSWCTTPRYGLHWVDSHKPGSFDQVTHRLSEGKWNHTQIHLPLFGTSNTQIRVNIRWITKSRNLSNRLPIIPRCGSM